MRETRLPRTSPRLCTSTVNETLIPRATVFPYGFVVPSRARLRSRRIKLRMTKARAIGACEKFMRKRRVSRWRLPPAARIIRITATVIQDDRWVMHRHRLTTFQEEAQARSSRGSRTAHWSIHTRQLVPRRFHAIAMFARSSYGRRQK